jgi:hypothetical protein
MSIGSRHSALPENISGYGSRLAHVGVHAASLKEHNVVAQK